MSTINASDMSSINDKINGMIHEDREDMTKFHQGLYNNQIQSIMKEEEKYLHEFEDAINAGDTKLANQLSKILNQFKVLEQIGREKGLITDGLTSEEYKLLNNAYKVPNNPVLKSSGNINEKVAENTRFRSEISRRHGFVTGEELDSVIDNLSDKELMDVLSSGKSYRQDYRKFIEENPKIKEEMINNIKEALKKVGVFTGVASGAASGLEGKVIEGKVDHNIEERFRNLPLEYK